MSFLCLLFQVLCLYWKQFLSWLIFDLYWTVVAYSVFVVFLFRLLFSFSGNFECLSLFIISMKTPVFLKKIGFLNRVSLLQCICLTTL